MQEVSTFPELRSERFLLRQIQQSDLAAVFFGLSHPKVIAHYGIWYETELATQEQIDWYRCLEKDGSGMWWAICPLNRPEQLIGACGVYELDNYNRNADIGYWLLPAYWGQGVMLECLQEVLHHAFDCMNLHRIEAEVEVENIGSRKLLKKLGFEHEGRRRQVSWKRDRFVDLDYYGILNTHFRKMSIIADAQVIQT